MVNMKQEDIKKAPKVFCESINIAYTTEYFVLGLTSGNQGTLYTITPQHAKRLSQYLEYQIKDFESKNGEITAKWDPNIVSPVQRITRPTEGS
jgi:hypothetical protein